MTAFLLHNAVTPAEDLAGTRVVTVGPNLADEA
jgi:hypothetical protein